MLLPSDNAGAYLKKFRMGGSWPHVAGQKKVAKKRNLRMGEMGSTGQERRLSFPTAGYLQNQRDGRFTACRVSFSGSFEF
jgi:hypothetical protein